MQGEGNTALHIATLKEHPDVVKILAKFGANLNISNKVRQSHIADLRSYRSVTDSYIPSFP